jgi:hypothetical protein
MTFQDLNVLLNAITALYAVLLIADKKHFKANGLIISILLINAVLGLIPV